MSHVNGLRDVVWIHVPHDRLQWTGRWNSALFEGRVIS